MVVKKKAGSGAAWRFAGVPVSPIDLPTQIERSFSERFQFVRDLRSYNPDSLLYVSIATMRTRESAARACLGLFHEQFSGKYSMDEIADAVATAASLPVSVTERCAKSPAFLLGAALWLLDYFDGSDLRDQLQSLLPERPENDMIFQVPLLDDLIHSPDDILRLMTVLCNRDGTGQDVFCGILHLIDTEAAAALRTTFKDCLLDYFSRYMEVCTRVKRSSSSDDAFPPVPDFPALPGIDPFRMERGFDSQEISRAKDSPDVTFLLLTPGLVGASDAELRDQLYFRRSVNLLRGFTIDDPHAVCAAYLLLEKEGDALASLNMLTSAVITCAERLLPWGIDEVRAFPKTFEDGKPDYELHYMLAAPDEGSAEDLPDVPAEGGQKLSEVQLFYFATGYALPRKAVPSQALTDWFTRQGLPEQRAREFAFGAMLAFYLDDLRERANLMFPDDDADDEINDAEPVSEKPVQAEETQYNAQISDMTRQIKDLRRALYESERMTKQFQAKLLEAEQRSAQEHTELSRLREVLYQMQSGGEQEVPGTEPAVELPWQVTRHVLIFGGHETWLKAIRPLLPGARFFEPGLLPDLGALKGADVIWIQANAISHKFFYRIINAARKWNIPVRYFGYASARKCAEQLAAEELTDTEAGV